MQTMNTVEQVSQRILKGEYLILAGDESVLKRLPKGNWIGGSTPYFMGDQGGEFNQHGVFVTDAPAKASKAHIEVYSPQQLNTIYRDLGENALGIIIIPAFSQCHTEFAMNAPEYEEFAMNPLVGWIAGYDLKQKENAKAWVFDGRSGSMLDNSAIVMKFELPAQLRAEVGIINLFHEDGGDVIEFPESGFAVEHALVNGKPVNFASYCKAREASVKLPLVSDYCGAKINTSLKSIGESRVEFYAPVFTGCKYSFASDLGDYVREFEEKVSVDGQSLYFSCNCILNYLFGKLEGKATKSIKGPITFGEIAYQLLNQTLVYVKLKEA